MSAKKLSNLREFFLSRERSSSSRLADCTPGSQRTINTVSSSSVQLEDRPPRIPKNVSFAEQLVIVHEAEEPIADQERQDYYYSAKDLESFEKDRGLTALMYMKRQEAGLPWEEKEYTLRGLEEILRKTPQQQGIRTIRREHMKKVVEAQKNAKYLDPERLREICCSSSKAERLRAMNRARQDAIFALAGNGRKAIMKKVLTKLSRQKNL